LLSYTRRDIGATQHAEISIDIDNGDSISDTGYETDSFSTASTTFASSARDYSFKNGYRYHKFHEWSYNFPNYGSEKEREDMTHAIGVNLCQRLHLAPIRTNPEKVLDVGTGAGIWSIESQLFNELQQD